MNDTNIKYTHVFYVSKEHNKMNKNAYKKSHNPFYATTSEHS